MVKYGYLFTAPVQVGTGTSLVLLLLGTSSGTTITGTGITLVENKKPHGGNKTGKLRFSPKF